MPIPQLSKPYKSSQGWKKVNKKSPKKATPRRNTANKKRTKKNQYPLFTNFKKKIIIFAVLSFFAVVIFSSVFLTIIARGLPDPNKLMERQLAESTKIYDRTGENVLYEIHGEEQRTLVDLEEIPDHVKWATIAIEDKNFYQHNGVSVWGILRGVVWQKIRGKRIQGGSTLTQQFIKNAVLTNERTITRKVKEWILAYRLEQKFTKDEILQLYLNEIPYGSTAYGVEAASQKYFGKSVKDINIAEAAILAALPQAPSTYSPYGNNRDVLIARQHAILNLMVEQNYISEEDAEQAKNYSLVFKQQISDIKAPHFVMYIKEQLSEKYGEKMVEQGGLKITTTLDLYKQEIAEEVVEEMGQKNEENYQASNASLVSIDPKTGQILAMVGSRDYFDDEIDGQVNISTSLRQPGSSLKPLVYASSFLKGLTPRTILYDVVTNFSQDKEDPYEPKNYDLEEHGPVSIRKALAGSLNVPAVKAIYITGVDNVLDLARDLGYTSLQDKDRFGLSLVLGGAEVRLLEHTNAYSAFAREGYISPIAGILKVEDRDGNIVEEWSEENERVIDPKISRAINSILSDNNARAYAYGQQNWLTLGDRPVAAKTGTTNDYRDAWTIGYTPSLVTGVWVGNNNNEAMKRGAAGGVVAAPVWNSYMKKILGDTPKESFNKYTAEETGKAILDGVIEGRKIIKIDKVSGLLATEETPENLVKTIELEEHHNILHYINKENPQGKIPENPQSDPQYNEWEEKVQAWAAEIASSTIAEIPTEYDNVHKEENKPSLKILSPRERQVILDKNLETSLDLSAPRGIANVSYYINGYLVAQTSRYPFSLNENISYLPNGRHNLKVRACDDVYNCTEEDVYIRVELPNESFYRDLELNLLTPSDGLNLENSDYPLSLKTQNNDYTQVSSIDYFYTNKEGEKIFIGNNQPVKSSVNEITWSKIPASGEYTLFAESTSWNSEITRSQEISIQIKNTAEQASSSDELIEE